jgi:PilZ domain-containing protein
MRERRKCPRLRTLKSAKLVLEKSKVLDCVVRDLTTSGARIEITNTIDLPQDLEVSFDSAGSRPCRLVWRTMSAAGLEFLNSGASVGQPYESAMQGQQKSAAEATCPKCKSGMTQVAITPHPVASRMLRHTYFCRACNQTRTYMLPAPVAAQAIYAGTSSPRVDVMVA